MLKEKHKVQLESEQVEEIKITNKTIVTDETFSTSWIGFNILFPSKVNRAELIFKFYDQRRQEIDLSSGNNKTIIELKGKHGRSILSYTIAKGGLFFSVKFKKQINNLEFLDSNKFYINSVHDNETRINICSNNKNR